MAVRRQCNRETDNSTRTSLADLLATGKIERIAADSTVNTVWSFTPWIELDHEIDIKSLYDQDEGDDWSPRVRIVEESS